MMPPRTDARTAMLPPPPLAVNWFRRPLLLLLLLRGARSPAGRRDLCEIDLPLPYQVPYSPLAYLPLSTWTQGSDAAASGLRQYNASCTSSRTCRFGTNM